MKIHELQDIFKTNEQKQMNKTKQNKNTNTK